MTVVLLESVYVACVLLESARDLSGHFAGHVQVVLGFERFHACWDGLALREFLHKFVYNLLVVVPCNLECGASGQYVQDP